MFFFDPTYFFLIALPTLLISGFVQMYLKSTFAKWSKVPNTENMNGLQVGQTLFAKTSLNPIPLERTRGSLTDMTPSTTWCACRNPSPTRPPLPPWPSPPMSWGMCSSTRPSHR